MAISYLENMILDFVLQGKYKFGTSFSMDLARKGWLVSVLDKASSGSF